MASNLFFVFFVFDFLNNSANKTELNSFYFEKSYFYLYLYNIQEKYMYVYLFLYLYELNKRIYLGAGMIVQLNTTKWP